MPAFLPRKRDRLVALADGTATPRAPCAGPFRRSCPAAAGPTRACHQRSLFELPMTADLRLAVQRQATARTQPLQGRDNPTGLVYYVLQNVLQEAPFDAATQGHCSFTPARFRLQ